MRAIPVLLTIVVALMLLLAGSAVLEGPIVRKLSRRWPGLAYDGGATLMVGMVVLAAFALGLLVMYTLR